MMKRIFLFFFVISATVSVIDAAAPKKKLVSAEVAFDITYKGVPAEEVESMPTKVVYLVNGSNSRQNSVSTAADGSKVVTSIIANHDSLMMVNLTDAGDDHQAIVYRAADLKEAQEGMTVVVKKKNDTKDILGYPCRKYEITITDKKTGEKNKEEVYATELIGGENINFLFYDEVKGFILYSKKSDDDSTTIMEAKKITKKNVSSSEFVIPQGYEIASPQ